MNRLTLLLAFVLMTGCATTAGGGRDLAQEEENKRLARAFTEEVYNQRLLDRIPVYVAADFVDLSVGAPPDARGPDFVRKQAEASLQLMPDLKFHLLHLLADGDLVLLHWKATGTDAKTPDAEGKPRALELHGHSLFRVRGGQLIESWDITDRLGLLLQQGFKVLPPARAPAPEPTPEPTPEPARAS